MLERRRPESNRHKVESERLLPLAAPLQPGANPPPLADTDFAPDIDKQTSQDLLSKKLAKTEFLINNEKDVFSNFSKLLLRLEALEKADRFRDEMYWLAVSISILLIPLRLYKIAYNIFFNKRDDRESMLDRVTTVIKTGIRMIISGINLLITLKLIKVVPIIGPIMTIISSTRSIGQNFWEIGVAFYNRFYSCEQKKENLEIERLKKIVYAKDIDHISKRDPDLVELTRLMSKKRSRNEKIFDGFHSLAQNIIGATGAIMTFTPLAPIGYIILGTCAIYGLMDGFDVNPFKMIGKGINAIYQRINGQSSLINTNPYKKLYTSQALAALAKAAPPPHAPKLTQNVRITYTQDTVPGSGGTTTNVFKTLEIDSLAAKPPSLPSTPVKTPHLEAYVSTKEKEHKKEQDFSNNPNFTPHFFLSEQLYLSESSYQPPQAQLIECQA